MTLYNSIMELEKEIDNESEDMLMIATKKDIFMYQGYNTLTNRIDTYVMVEDGKYVGDNGERRSFKPEVLKNTLTGGAIVDYNKIIKSVGIFTEEMNKSMKVTNERT